MVVENIYRIVFGVCLAYIYYMFFETFLIVKGWKLRLIDLYLVMIGVANNYIAIGLNQIGSFPESTWIAISIIRSLLFFVALMVPLAAAWKKKIFLIACCFALTFLSQNVALFLYAQIAGETIGQLLSNPALLAQIITFSHLVFLLFVALIRFVRIRKKGKNSSTIYVLDIFVPLISMVVFVYLIFLGYAGTIGILIFLVNTITLYLIFFLHYGATAEYAFQAQIQLSREQHYQNLEAHQAEIHKIKHDLTNQLIAMSGFIQAGLPEKANEEIGGLIKQLAESEKYTFTENPGINGLLAQKFSRAEQEGIVCTFDICLPKHTAFQDADLASLFGNILDNALEACQLCDGPRHIKLKVLYEEDMLIIQGENSTDGKTKTLKTRKKDTLWHGIGMESIKQVVDKYNGQMEYQFSKNHFTIELSLFPRE